MHQMLKIHIEKKEFHHAYLLYGDVEGAREQALEAAKAILMAPMSRFNFDIGAHPDFSHQQFELFGIENSRELKNWAASRSFYGNGKVFVMEVGAFNNESSNALLKTLEEPNEGTHFFIITSSIEAVMPTLRSRLTVLKLGREASNLEVELPSADTELARNFLKSLPNKRMEAVKKLSDEKKEKKIDKTKVVDFLNNLEVTLERKIKSTEMAERKMAITTMEELQKGREFIFDKGSSAKMILEHLALTLPKF